jgi:hypothetical protein
MWRRSHPPDAMSPTKVAAAGLALLLVAAGGGAALSASPATQPDTGDSSSLRDADVASTYDDGTVTVTVTSNGTGVENVSVYADDEHVDTTDANGAVSFEATDDEELEVELVAGDFEGELAYAIEDGSLVLVEEEYEYADPEDDGEDAGEADDEADDEEDGSEEADDEEEPAEDEDYEDETQDEDDEADDDADETDQDDADEMDGDDD